MKNSTGRKLLLILGIVFTLLLVTSCAKSNISNLLEDPYGFWSGIWHGLITPISFIVSLFDSDVVIYSSHNTGGWYDFGFLIGVSITFGGSGSGVKRCR